MFVTMLKRTWPLALLGGLGVMNQRIGVLLLSFLAGDTPAGWYAAAFRIVEGLKLTHYAFLGALLPLAARMAADGLSDASVAATEPLTGLVHRSRRVLVGLGVAAALGANLLATPIVLVLYGQAYEPAVAALRILAWGLVPFAAAAPTAMALVSTGHELVVVRIGALGVAVALSIGAMLIPMAGVNGACIAMLAGEVVRCALLMFETGRIGVPRLAGDAAV
jgi:O-antigen/teichoic acid export membrane protein